MLAYHFGSTQSSAEKNLVIDKLAEAPRTVEIANPPTKPIPTTEVPEPDFHHYPEDKP